MEDILRTNYDEREGNPNTVGFWNNYYNLRKVERKNNWLFTSVLVNLKPVVKVKQQIEFLDVGCGMGRTMMELKKLFKVNFMDVHFNMTGVDISYVAISNAAKKYGAKNDLRWILSDVGQEEPRKIGYGEYDFILCAETLEHITKPDCACNNMVANLKDGGTIFITVPVYNSHLDTNSVNKHYTSFESDDFSNILFKGMNVELYEIDKNHLSVIVKKN